MMDMIKAFSQNFEIVYGGFISKYGFTRFLVAAVMVAALGVGILYGSYVVIRGVAALSRGGGDRAVATITTVQTLGSLGLVVAILLTGMQIFGQRAMVKEAAVEEYVVDTQALLLLREDRWAELTQDLKVKVLQALVDAERKKLGISERLTVKVSDLPERRRGEYLEEDGSITVDTDILESAPVQDVINTVCHEMKHSYQHRLVAVYEQTDPKDRGLKIFENVADYRREFEDYIDGDEDFDGYYDQMCENDARYYAAVTTEEYCAWLAEMSAQEAAS